MPQTEGGGTSATEKQRDRALNQPPASVPRPRGATTPSEVRDYAAYKEPDFYVPAKKRLPKRGPQGTPAEQVGVAIKARAAQLPNSLVLQAPDIAAYLVTSRVGTAALRTVAKAWQDAMGANFRITTTTGIPSSAVTAIVQHEDPWVRQNADAIIQGIAQLPPNKREFVLANLESLKQNTGIYGDITHAIELTAAPFIGAGYLLSETAKGASWALSKVPVVGPALGAGVDILRQSGGALAQGAMTDAEIAARVLEGVAVTGLTATVWPFQTEEQKAESGVVDRLLHYMPTWDEARGLGHAPTTWFLAEVQGWDPDDPLNAHKAQMWNAVSDLVAGEVLFRTARSLKDSRLTPAEVSSPGAFGIWNAKQATAWVASKPGKAFLRRVERIIAEHPDDAAGWIQQGIVNVDAILSGKLARGYRGDRPSIARVLEEHYAQPVNDVAIKAVQDRHAAVVKSIDEAVAAEQTETAIALRADEIALRQQLQDMMAQQPAWQYPLNSRLHAIMYDVPTTPLERMLHAIYSPVRRNVKLADPRRLVDEMTQGGRIWSQFDARRPSGWATENADYISNLGNVVRASPESVAAVLDRMAKLTDPADYHNWVTRDVAGMVRDGLTRGGKRRLTQEMEQAIRLTERSIEERRTDPVHITAIDEFGKPHPVLKNVLEDATTGEPLPSAPIYFAQSYRRFDIQAVRRVSSTMHNWDQRMLQTPVLGGLYGVAHVPFDVVRKSLDLTTMLGKPLLLDIRQIPILQKITLDQALRNTLMEGVAPFAIRKRLATRYNLPGGSQVLKGGLKELLPEDALGNPDVTVLGGLTDEAMRTQEVITHTVDTTGLSVAERPELAAEVARAQYQTMTTLHGDHVYRLVAQRGPEAALQYIEARPLSAAGLAAEQMKGTLERAGVTPLDWLQGLERRIDEASGGMPQFRQYIATGKFNPPDVIGGTTRQAFVRDAIVKEIRDGTEGIRRARAEGDVALEHEIAARLEELDTRLAAIDATASGKLRLGDEIPMTDEILARFTNGEYTMPPTVGVQRYVATDPAKGLMENAARASGFLYRGMKYMGKADIAATRGSLFFQLYERYKKGLLANGWDEALADYHAQYRAAMRTSDVMYDISARTSAQRSVRNIFWFAPAIQEQLTTWLIDMPSRAYWPVGMAIRANQAKTLWETMQSLGWVQQDQNGNSYSRVPGLNKVAEKLLGAVGIDVNIPDIVNFDPTNLNIVGQGSPTVQPMAAAWLNLITDHVDPELKPLLERITEAVTWEGPNSYLPSGLNTILMAMGMTPPDSVSGTHLEWTNQRAQDQSYQYAMSDLAEEGIVPPVPGDFDDPDKFTAAREEFIAQVDSEAAKYAGGLTAVRLIGSLLFPTSLTATSPEREAFYKWKQEQGVAYPYTDADFTAIDEYVAAHPKAWPFAIGYYQQEKDVPGVPDNAPLAEKLAAGEVSILSAEDYMVKAQAIAGLSAEESRFRGELKAMKVATAQQQLFNRADYLKVYADHLVRVDKWLAGNPEIEAYLASKNDTILGEADREMVLGARRLLTELKAEGYFTGKDGLPATELAVVMGMLGDAASQYDYGPADSPQAAKKQWFYEMVYGPVADKVAPLYRKANVLGEGLQDTAPIYDEIRRIYNAANKDYFFPTYNEYGKGVTYDTTERFPTPEEYSYYSKSPEQRLYGPTGTLNWATKPPTWLTEFQLDTAGFAKFEGRTKMLDKLRKMDEEFWADKQHIEDTVSTGETAALEAREKKYLEDVRRLGGTYGQEGSELARLFLATPDARLVATGYGKNNSTWREMMAGAEIIRQRIEAQGLSIRGYAAAYTYGAKQYLESIIEDYRNRGGENYDPEFDRLWTQLESSIPERGRDRRRGVSLYEAILFGQFETTFIPDEFVRAVYGNG